MNLHEARAEFGGFIYGLFLVAIAAAATFAFLLGVGV